MKLWFCYSTLRRREVQPATFGRALDGGPTPLTCAAGSGKNQTWATIARRRESAAGRC